MHNNERGFAMIIEKLITFLFKLPFFADLNIDLPGNWFSSIRTLFGAGMVLNDVVPLSHVASSLTWCVLFTLACASCRFVISLIRG